MWLQLLWPLGMPLEFLNVYLSTPRLHKKLITLVGFFEGTEDRDGVVERNTFHCELFGTNLPKRKGHFLLKSHFRSFSWNENFTGLRLSCKCHYKFVLLFCGLLYHPVVFIFITSSFSWATISKCTLCLIDHILLIWSQVIFFLPTSELLFLKCGSFWIAFVSYIRSFLHIGGILRKILSLAS